MPITQRLVGTIYVAEKLGISVSSVHQGKGGTKNLTVKRLPGSNRLKYLGDEVDALVENAVTVREKGKRIK